MVSMVKADVFDTWLVEFTIARMLHQHESILRKKISKQLSSTSKIEARYVSKIHSSKFKRAEKHLSGFVLCVLKFLLMKTQNSLKPFIRLLTERFWYQCMVQSAWRYRSASILCVQKKTNYQTTRTNRTRKNKSSTPNPYSIKKNQELYTCTTVFLEKQILTINSPPQGVLWHDIDSFSWVPLCNDWHLKAAAAWLSPARQLRVRTWVPISQDLEHAL